MRKIFVALLLLIVFASSLVHVFSQGRPRRVSEGANQHPAQAPARPPVLGGANRPPGQQQSKSETPEETGPEEVDAGDIIKVNTTLVTVPVSVMDRDGRYVPNLQKDDFRIWEDNVEQDVAFFASVEKPFSVFLMLDTSPSTKFRLDEIQDAAISFVNQLRADDKVMVVSFNEEIRVLSDLTTDRTKLHYAIRRARTGNGTSLYDALDFVVNRHLSRTPGRKAIVLFTDGVDTTSKWASYESTTEDALELDALIYPVRYDTSGDINTGGWPSPSRRIDDVWGQILGGIFGGGRRRGGIGGSPRGRGGDDYQLAARYLHQLARSTGGRLYDADTHQNMAYAFANVAEELRRQYSIGYYPRRTPQPGERREIRVRTNQPNLAVRAREGYIFNPSGAAVVDANSRSQKPPVLRRLLEERDRGQR